MNGRAFVLLAFLLLPWVGCRNMKGDKGDPGPSGSANVVEYSGRVPTALKVGIVRPVADKVVTVFWAPQSFPNNFTQLGNPTGDNAIGDDPWVWIDVGTAMVNFVNVTAGDHYRIFVFTPTETFNNWTAIRSRFLDD